VLNIYNPDKKKTSENLSKLDILGTTFCGQNRQVFGIYMLNQQRFPTLGLNVDSLKSVERFDHMMFVCRFQASL
jgi:hypothetical protein